MSPRQSKAVIILLAIIAFCLTVDTGILFFTIISLTHGL